MKKLLKWTIKDICESIEVMTSNEVKFDCIIFIEGKRGLGKSTLAYKILNKLDVEHPFKPRKDIVYSREDTLSHLANKKNGCIFSDEMINVAYKRDFYEQDQKELLKAFDMYRDSRNIFIGCIPKFIDLDVKIQKVCKMKISVIRRGFALIHLPLDIIYSSDPWDTKNNQKIEAKWALKGTKNPRYGQLTTCVGYVTYSDLTPNQRAEYDAIKEEKRSHVFAKYTESQASMDPETIFYTNVIKLMKEGKINPQSFELLCIANNKMPITVRNNINKILRETNDSFSAKDYITTKERYEKRTKLGFKMPVQIEEG